MPNTLIAAMSLLIGVALTLLSVTVTVPQCWEDEVIVWTGEAHDTCVPADDYVDIIEP